ncbi:unnamed protein product [Spodoptera littoralis]|uniref:Uncharacterized protein n=1 Tax=Spodoptera littoralis TaxID=7109 RepID=A0A9P0HX65_SPOLI|nr:unnamed protein product [Spodoptera littoralis]
MCPEDYHIPSLLSSILLSRVLFSTSNIIRLNTFEFRMMHFLSMLLLSATVHCYHRDYGPIFGPFNPTYIDLVTECTETDTHSCLVIPTKKICREKLAVPLNPCLPLPWWYFYCQWVVTLPPPPKPKTSTVHPFYRKTLDAVLEYKKGLKNRNNFYE